LEKINDVSLKAVPARRDTGVKFHSLHVGKSYANSITKTTHNLTLTLTLTLLTLLILTIKTTTEFRNV